MDHVTAADVLRALVRSIEADVIPAVEDQYARAQLWASTGMLGNLARELDPAGERDPAPSISDDLASFLRAFGLERALEDGEGAAAAAALLRENLSSVVAGHATLHYRRAVAGFEEE